MSTTITDLGKLIARHREIHGGCPIIAGTGVTVRRIVIWYKQGYNPEEIADEISHLTLAQVYAALAYYHLNQEEIDADLAAEEAEGDLKEIRFAVRIETLHQTAKL